MPRGPLHLPQTPEEHREFRGVIKAIITTSKIRDKEIKENSEIYQEKYGIKYCPFHKALVQKVEEKGASLKLDGKNYRFMRMECSLWKMCESYISFDKELLDKLKNLESLVEVKPHKLNVCVTCGSKKGRVYFTGLGLKTLFSKEPLYVFERPCHQYTVANYGASRLEPKKSVQQPPLGELRIIMQK